MWLPSDAATFDGRNVFAPVAANLCRGIDIEEMGPRLDPALLTPSLLPFSAEKDGVIQADVLWIDRFGNVQLNVSPEQLADFGEQVVVTAGNHRFVTQRVAGFDSLAPGATGLIIDANGLVALVLDQASAAERYAMAEQDSVTLARPENA